MTAGRANAVLIRAVIAGICLAAPLGSARAADDRVFRTEPLPPEPPLDEAPKPVRPLEPSRASPRPSDACGADVGEHSGIVSLAVDDPARAGQATTYTLDGITYAARFDGGGHLTAEGPMFHAAADLAWTGTDGSACRRRGIPFSNYDEATFAALIWPAGSVELGLDAVEPDGSLGGARGFVSPDRPNLDLSSARGRLLRFGAAVPGTSQVQLYVLPPDRNPRRGSVYLFVDFVTRGNPARPPFCGAGDSATASYKLVQLSGGQLDNHHGGRFAAVPCGTRWSAGQIETEYLQRWKLGL